MNPMFPLHLHGMTSQLVGGDHLQSKVVRSSSMCLKVPSEMLMVQSGHKSIRLCDATYLKLCRTRCSAATTLCESERAPRAPHRRVASMAPPRTLTGAHVSNFTLLVTANSIKFGFSAV